MFCKNKEYQHAQLSSEGMEDWGLGKVTMMHMKYMFDAKLTMHTNLSLLSAISWCEAWPLKMNFIIKHYHHVSINTLQISDSHVSIYESSWKALLPNLKGINLVQRYQRRFLSGSWIQISFRSSILIEALRLKSFIMYLKPLFFYFLGDQWSHVQWSSN